MNGSEDYEKESETVSGSDSQNEKSRKNRMFTITIIAFVIVVALYLVYHLFSYLFNGYNTVVKKEFSSFEECNILAEIDALLSENSFISAAKYTGGKNPVLMVWIDGIENGVEFIENSTGFDPLSYKSVSLAVSQTTSVAARYYSMVKDGEEKASECYLYKIDSAEKWTAYFIENDITEKSIKEMFVEEDE